MSQNTQQGTTDPTAAEQLALLITQLLNGSLTSAQLQELLLAYLQSDSTTLLSGGSANFEGLLGAVTGTGGTGTGGTANSAEPTTTGAETVTFQQNDANGFVGTQDTYLQESAPGVNNAGSGILLVDGDSPSFTGQQTQVLLSFGPIVGNNATEIPQGATVTEAYLELDTVDPGDGANLHRMIYEWSPTETWATALNGIALDDVQAVSTPDATVESASLGPTYVDVTQSVQEWVTNEGNRGWVFEPLGDEGWGFGSAEGTVPPKLVVSYDPPAQTN